MRTVDEHNNELRRDFVTSHLRNKMYLDQLPWFAIFKLHMFIPPSQRGDLVKIHLAASPAYFSFT